MAVAATRPRHGGIAPSSLVHVANCWAANGRPSSTAGHAVSAALLCGVDFHTQKDYSHRRDWIVNRWENRFKCRECTDESAVLLCGIYVDLNAFRAGEADAPETSALHVDLSASASAGMRKNPADRPDAWLGELTLQPERKSDEVLACTSRRSGRRASDESHSCFGSRQNCMRDGPHADRSAS